MNKKLVNFITKNNKMKLFLASSLYQTWKKLTQHIGNLKNKTIAYITNPADKDITQYWTDLWRIKNDRDFLNSLGAKLHAIDLKKDKKEKLKKELQNYDIIYVSWGNTYYFKELCIESWFNTLIKEAVQEWWKIYISTSTGSCMAGNNIKYVESWRNNFQHFEWFNFINATILPHRGSLDFQKEYETLIPQIYKSKKNIITLTDKQAITMGANSRKIVENK